MFKSLATASLTASLHCRSLWPFSDHLRLLETSATFHPDVEVCEGQLILSGPLAVSFWWLGQYTKDMDIALMLEISN